MSIQPVQSVFPFELGPVSKPISAAERLQLDVVASPPGGGAQVVAGQPVAPAAGIGSLDVKNLYAALNVGMKSGFVAPGHARVVSALGDFEKPNSTLTPGQMYSVVMTANAEAALGDVVAKIGNKVAEALQTIVVKQS
jgi:hypothetical protein